MEKLKFKAPSILTDVTNIVQVQIVTVWLMKTIFFFCVAWKDRLRQSACLGSFFFLVSVWVSQTIQRVSLPRVLTHFVRICPACKARTSLSKHVREDHPLKGSGVVSQNSCLFETKKKKKGLSVKKKKKTPKKRAFWGYCKHFKVRFQFRGGQNTHWEIYPFPVSRWAEYTLRYLPLCSFEVGRIHTERFIPLWKLLSVCGHGQEQEHEHFLSWG